MSRRAPVGQGRASAALLGLLLAAGLGGCGLRPVAVSHTPMPGTEAACAALMNALPDVVGDGIRRDVTADEAAAAWGSPPVVLRCGTGLPTDYRLDATLTEVDGVAWFVSEGQGGTFFTAVELEPVVEVEVPEQDSPEVDVLLDLAPWLSATRSDGQAPPRSGE